ncbi:MAG: 1-phosphofructokinase family hexose kinase [Acetobacteraceae bacterium]
MAKRILTLTLNPALDLSSTADAVEPTHKIRTTDEHIDPGGGGINVARVIHAMGFDVMALILAGGVTGHLLDELLAEQQVPRRILPMQGRTRISLTVYDRTSGLEYRFVPEGPILSADELEAAIAAVDHAESEWLIASGSIPRGVPADIYARLARNAADRGRKFVLDTSGEPLKLALHHGVHLMKPSLRELETMVGRPLPTREVQEAEALGLVRSGAARMVAVSLGADGAMLATEDGVVHMPALKGPVRSAVGAGDAFLASLTLALARGADPSDALAWGIAAGAAAVAQVGTARVTRRSVEAQYQRLRDQTDAYTSRPKH